jgi:hypothetical protein
MKHHLITSRRLVAVAAAAAAALTISSAAYAATSSGSAHTTAAAIPRCSGGLGTGAWVAIDQGNGALGTIYYPLEFTNLSGRTCYLYGYPGVSAVSGSGQQLGSPAPWGSLRGARVVILAPGATAHTILAYHDAAVSTEPGCDPVYTTALLRVYLPGQYLATDAEFDLEACSHKGPIFMNIIEPIRAGVGTING